MTSIGSGLNRRDFLKALGIGTSTSVVSACGFDQNYYRSPIEEILPYVVRPDQVIPGTFTFFTTSITPTGPHAFPLLARHRDGRVVNVGANFRAPVAPAVPGAALFELQRHYSPDRYKGPESNGAAVDWTAGLTVLSDAVKGAAAGGKKVAWLGPYRSGAIAELIEEYTGGNAVFYEPLGYEAEASAAELLFGQRVLPAYRLAGAHYLLSFGADFMGGWGNPALASEYSEARDPNKGNFITRFALVSPRRGQTGANADDWFAPVPGTEALVAMAIARLVAERLNYSGPLSALVGAVDIDAAATASGLAREVLDGIAAQFAAAPAVALPGGVHGSSRAAVDLAVATYVLNIVSGNAGQTFGLGPVYAGRIDGLERLAQLIAQMAAGEIAVLLIDDHTNPVYSLPAALGFAEALAKVPLVVALSSHPDETTANAKLRLPISDVFEDWGDEEPEVGLTLIRQPSMTALNDTRSIGDILLATAKTAGLGAAAAATPPAAVPAAGAIVPAAVPATPVTPTRGGFDHLNWREYIRARWQRTVGAAAPVFEEFWATALQNGFVDARQPLSAPVPTGSPTIGPAAPIEGTGELTLITYPHPFTADGRYSNQPWAQEMPDPETGNVWDSWVEIHPVTADRLGLHDNSFVEVASANGKIQLGVTRYRGVREDVVAIAFGQGHTANGRYANGTGQNVVQLLGATAGTPVLAWQQAKVSVRKISDDAKLVSTFGAPDDYGRDIAAFAPATELAKVGDAESSHPGELTGIHVFALDKRLQDAKITDFYPIPDHPVYRFGLTVDVNACNGCSICMIACYAENNLPIVGKQKMFEGREMSWIRINRYQAEGEENVRFLPMMCQQCAHAPCESVCPVLATYHTIDGLNAMVYNRCVGTRYCSNNCPYKVRRFNWHSYVWPEPFNLQLNPDVTTRTMGVMEKCTFCVQRIRAVKSAYRNQGFTTTVPDSELRQLPACVEACPTQALTFGNINDEASVTNQSRKSARSYFLFPDLNTFPAVNYLAKATYHPRAAAHHGAAPGAHGEEGAAHPAEGHEAPPVEQPQGH